jgi:hypothetical protein
MESVSSKSSSTRLLMIAGVALVAVLAVAVLLIPRRSPADDPANALARKEMISDLRALEQIETNSLRFAGRYTSDPREAGHLSSVGVNPPVVTLVDSGWTAVVSPQRASGFQCAIGVNAKNPLSRQAKSGEIVCR